MTSLGYDGRCFEFSYLIWIGRSSVVAESSRSRGNELTTEDSEEQYFVEVKIETKEVGQIVSQEKQ